MLESCRNIREISAGKSFTTYVEDDVFRWAVERQFTILGEALYSLSRRFPDIASKVPQHHDIVAFRHVLVHGYADVRNQTVWEIVETELEQLERVLSELITNLSE